jgi:hypothetical protein
VRNRIIDLSFAAANGARDRQKGSELVEIQCRAIVDAGGSVLLSSCFLFNPCVDCHWFSDADVLLSLAREGASWYTLLQRLFLVSV